MLFRSSGIIDAFIDALENDHEPVISGKDVLAAMRAVFASIQSSQEDRTIRIPENELSSEEREFFGKMRVNSKELAARAKGIT